MALQAGGKAKGSDYQNLTVQTHNPYDSGTVTSTSFTTTRSGGTSPVGVAFTAPPSGKVLIHFGAGLLQTAPNPSLVTFQILAGSVIGSGSSISAASDNRSLQAADLTEKQMGRTCLIDGLTPGSSYNASLMYRRQTGGTFTINRVELIVDPCIS